ncbi:MAG: hypothetical protein Tsb0027_24200 [Wenzhouxiangellaceae bacterium]
MKARHRTAIADHLLAASLLLGSAIAPGAAADELTLGLGVGWLPEFEGSNDFRTIPLPSFKYKTDWIEIKPSQLGLEADLFPGAKFDLGPIVRYGSGRNDRRRVDDPVVSLLEKVDDAMEFGFAFSGGVPVDIIGIDDPGIIATRIEVIHGLNSGHGGTTVEGAFRFVRPLSNRFTMVSSLSLTWASSDYQRAFFSVTPEDALRSGLPEFQANAGLKDVAVSLAGRYKFNERWRSSVIFQLRRLVGTASDSPIVSIRGNPNQPFMGINLEYKVF